MGKNPGHELTPENFHEHYRRLARVALKAAQTALRRPDQYEDAKDAASEAMMNLAARLVEGKPLNNPEAFVTRVAQRRAIDRVRRHARLRSFVEGTLRDLIQTTSPAASEDLEQIVMRARAHMTERQRECFDWHHLGNLQVPAIARLLGIEASTVRNHLNGAHKVLLEELR